MGISSAPACVTSSCAVSVPRGGGRGGGGGEAPAAWVHTPRAPWHPGAGGAPGCAELAWDYTNPCSGSAGAAGVTGAGTEGTTGGHRGWHQGVPQKGCLAPVGAAEGVSWALWGWGGGSLALGGGGQGVMGPRGAPLTLPLCSLQPLVTRMVSDPQVCGGSGRRWVPHPSGAQPRWCRALPWRSRRRGALCPPAA